MSNQVNKLVITDCVITFSFLYIIAYLFFKLGYSYNPAGEGGNPVTTLNQFLSILYSVILIIISIISGYKDRKGVIIGFILSLLSSILIFPLILLIAAPFAPFSKFAMDVYKLDSWYSIILLPIVIYILPVISYFLSKIAYRKNIRNKVT